VIAKKRTRATDSAPGMGSRSEPRVPRGFGHDHLIAMEEATEVILQTSARALTALRPTCLEAGRVFSGGAARIVPIPDPEVFTRFSEASQLGIPEPSGAVTDLVCGTGVRVPEARAARSPSKRRSWRGPR
jgi:hypothetical protein